MESQNEWTWYFPKGVGTFPGSMLNFTGVPHGPLLADIKYVSFDSRWRCGRFACRTVGVSTFLWYWCCLYTCTTYICIMNLIDINVCQTSVIQRGFFSVMNTAFSVTYLQRLSAFTTSKMEKSLQIHRVCVPESVQYVDFHIPSQKWQTFCN